MSKDLTLKQVTEAGEVIDTITEEFTARGRKLEYRTGDGFRIVGTPGTFTLVQLWEWLQGKGPPTGSA